MEGKPVLALLAGSRKQEIKDNLPMMVEAASVYAGQYELVLAAAPNIDPEFYGKVLRGSRVKILYGQTYRILHHACAALVTSGTATLETALFRVPQVVCYYTACGKLVSFLRRHILKVQSGSRARGGQGVGGRRDERGEYTGGTFSDSARRKRTHSHVAGL